MEPLRNELSWSVPEALWSNTAPEDQSQEGRFDSFIGICVGLGLGLVGWGGLLLVYFAFWG